MTKMNFGKYSVEISHPNKVLFPKTAITKLDLANYYRKISDYILPHIKDRPITMHRYPNGIKDKNFFHKDASDFFPDWIKTEKIKKKEGGSLDAVICNNAATLVYLANLASITQHIWLSKIDNLKKPDKIIFDLDPPGKNFKHVKKAAKIVNNFCTNRLGINTFLMTTGSRGMHVIIPLKVSADFNSVRTAAQKIAEIISKEHSDELTTEVRKEKRKGKLFLDTARNAYGQTVVSPYSVRALENAPVAVPLDWKELNRSKLNAQTYNVKNIFNRLANKNDPWKEINRSKVSFSKIEKELKRIE